MPGSKIFDGLNLDKLTKERLLEEIETAIGTHEMLNVFMNSVEDGFSILDKNLVYMTVNDALLERTGFTQEYMVDRSIPDIAPDAVVTGRIEIYRNVLRTGEPETIDRVPSYDGNRTLRVFAFKSGENLGLITRDISDEVRFEETLLELQQHAIILRECDSLKQVYDATIDAMRNVLKHNACDILMIKNEHLRQVASSNLPIDLKIPLNGKGLTVRAINSMESVLENDTASNTNYIVAEDMPDSRHSDEFPISRSELVVPIILENEAIGVLNVESTKLNAFTSNDRLLLEILAIQVASAIKGINDFKKQLDLYKELYDNKSKIEQAEEMNRLKTNFMSSATHEIRTPITSIKGYVDMIIEDRDDLDKEILSQYLEVIQRNVDRLENLSNDLLDNMRFEHHRIELNYSTVNFSDFINQIVIEIQPILLLKKQQIKVVCRLNDYKVICDEARISQVLINLISNASNYSDRDSVIEIECRELGDSIRVEVSDDGIGVKREEIDKLFTPFPDIQNSPIKRGTGLGLSICRGIIELHGGRIWMESEGLGKGATVVFEIPKTSK